MDVHVFAGFYVQSIIEMILFYVFPIVVICQGKELLLCSFSWLAESITLWWIVKVSIFVLAFWSEIVKESVIQIFRGYFRVVVQ
jgi:hypothetical protein